MIYLGQGHRGSGVGLTQDELKVLQQVNGGENICVFKGLVTPGGRSCFAKVAKRGTKIAFSFKKYNLKKKKNLSNVFLIRVIFKHL